MGKGDRRTRRGKTWRGSFGTKRPRKKKISQQESKQSGQSESSAESSTESTD